MALVPCQVLRVAILLSYCSILCNYKAIEMPSHQTYGGSWKFLTFIDLCWIRETMEAIEYPELWHRHTQAEHHVKMKAEVGVMLLQAKQCQRLPGNYQKLGERHGRDFPQSPQKEPIC
ncbi:androgen-induced gene 1 protein isoform X7 [Diceros bicornis minor]|uniref:androgen-induced gene 1 protein isoform X7 n=1 Tax=Diceros bicornis minor TaxID=77932 RepID=UPI0026EC3870|nr:androgen-induced gene 1 protein isoform X7 [Diceros bicornis minor]